MADLARVEHQLVLLKPKFLDVLPPNLPAERIIRTVMISVGKMPSLANDMRSLMSAAMTAAVLGLEADGIMGQGCVVPFKGKAQFLPMIGGYCTLAARAGRTLDYQCVYEGDEFSFNLAEGYIHHEWTLGQKRERVIGAWARSRSNDAPAMAEVMGLDEILEVRNNSAGYKRGSTSPWTTHFPAMAAKTVGRKLAKRLPVLSLQIAQALDAQHDLGRHAYVKEDQTVEVEGEVITVEQPGAEELGLDAAE